MDARRGSLALLALFILSNVGWSQQNGFPSANFLVHAQSPQLAQEVSQAAEQLRRDLAIHWLGQEIPNWSRPCPIRVMAAPNRGAGGKTTFTLMNGTVGGWEMDVEGSRERILDSVLPHEITHTIFATYFAPLGKPVPRWADEGASTTVEHASERSKHDQFLVQFLSTGRGLPFAVMFTLRDYPQDIMPLYAQGYSVATFLIAQGGPRRFVSFLKEGMETEDWVTSVERHYGYPKVGKLQSAWNKWVGDGGGRVDGYSAVALGLAGRQVASADPGLGNVRLASSTNGMINSAPQGPTGPINSGFAPPQNLGDPPSMMNSIQGSQIMGPASFAQQGAQVNGAASMGSNEPGAGQGYYQSQFERNAAGRPPVRLSDTPLPQYNLKR